MSATAGATGGATEQRNFAMGYRELRLLVGGLGFIYPLLLPAYCYLTGQWEGWQPTVSAYYHQACHDLFVGVLFAIAVFFVGYHGPEVSNRADDYLGDAAGVGALGVALFPTAAGHPEIPHWVGIVHGVASGVLFAILGAFSFVLFTRTRKGAKIEGQKRRRNLVYRSCGVVIWICILLIGAFNLFKLQAALPNLGFLPTVYTLETIALLAFGASWLTKAELFFPDPK
jgi:hypothetical protein